MRRLVAAVLAASFAFLALSGVAGAQGNETPPPPSYLPDPDVRGLPASKYQLVVASEDCKLDLGNNGIVGAITAGIPGAGAVVGAIPGIPAPDAICPGAIAKDGIGKATQGFWAGGIVIVSIMTDAVESLLAFDIGNLLAPAVDQASHAVQTKIADRFQLGYFALAAAALVVAFMFLTGRFVHAVGELARVVLALAIAGLILSNVAGFYRSTSTFGREASAAGLEVAGDSNPQRPLDSVREALIWDQWQGMQFEDTLPPQCADAAFAALRDDKSVIKSVDAAGCHDEAKRAQKPSWKRFFAAVAYFFLALTIAWQLGKIALGMIFGQVALALSMAFAPLACAIAPFRWSRPLFAGWLAGIGKFLVGMIIAALTLAITVLFIGAIMAQPWLPFWRLVTAAGVTLAVSHGSRRWLESAENATHRGTTRAVVGGAAVGAAGAVAAQGIVSSVHARSDGMVSHAGATARRTVGQTAKQAGGQGASRVADAGKQAAASTPAAKSIQDRRTARHRVDREEDRERVRAAVDAERERRNRPDTRRPERRRPKSPT